MSDLIWIGNTLYPRWFVIAVVLGGLALLAVLCSWIASRATKNKEG